MRWWNRVANIHHKKCAEYLAHACAALEFVPHRIAEIGVFKGHTSERLRYFWPHAELYLVDPWVVQPRFGGWCYRGNPKQADWDAMYGGVAAMFKGDERVRVLRMTSAEAAKQVDNLDLVFIDAIHTKQGVLDDISLWLPKLNRPGIISGHDYNESGPYKGVGAAVKEKFGKRYVTGSPKMWLRMEV